MMMSEPIFGRGRAPAAKRRRLRSARLMIVLVLGVLAILTAAEIGVRQLGL